jgi:hypothetical protein
MITRAQFETFFSTHIYCYITLFVVKHFQTVKVTIITPGNPAISRFCRIPIFKFIRNVTALPGFNIRYSIRQPRRILQETRSVLVETEMRALRIVEAGASAFRFFVFRVRISRFFNVKTLEIAIRFVKYSA